MGFLLMFFRGYSVFLSMCFSMLLFSSDLLALAALVGPCSQLVCSEWRGDHYAWIWLLNPGFSQLHSLEGEPHGKPHSFEEV